MSIAQSNLFTPTYQKLMREFPLRQIRNKKDADAATKILDKRFRERFDDPGEEEYVMILADLLADYEEKTDPVPDTATSADVLNHLMQSNDLTQGDIGKLLDIGQSAVSMILSGERQLTTEHIRRLAKRFNVSPAVFI
jgi:HTH-type transcriptional regulator / antitoxin HigA